MKVFGVLTLLTGVGLALVETWLNWGDWQWAPFFVVDFVAAVLLVAAGALAIRGNRFAGAMLMAAWYFCVGMVWMSFFANMELGCPDRPSHCDAYLTLVGSFFALCALGAAISTWLGWRRSQAPLDTDTVTNETR